MSMRRILTRAAALPLALLFLLGLAPDRAIGQEMDADASRWMVRSHVSGVLIDGTSPALQLDVGNALAVGTDITFFATPKIGVNLLAAFISPEVEAGTPETSIGSVDALPPALTLQYHFMDEGPIRPYLGAGASLVTFFNYTGTLETADVDIDPGFGPVAQGGLNLYVSDRFAVMADVRWVWLLNDPSVTSALGNDELDFSHGILSVGLGYTP